MSTALLTSSYMENILIIDWLKLITTHIEEANAYQLQPFAGTICWRQKKETHICCPRRKEIRKCGPCDSDVSMWIKCNWRMRRTIMLQFILPFERAHRFIIRNREASKLDLKYSYRIVSWQSDGSQNCRSTVKFHCIRKCGILVESPCKICLTLKRLGHFFFKM